MRGWEALAILLAAACSASCSQRPAPVPDHVLLENFSRAHPAMERLRAMISAEPRVTLVAPEAIALDCSPHQPAAWAAGSLAAERRDAYTGLLRQAGLRAVQRRGDGTIMFWMTWDPRAADDLHAESKGYLWSRAVPKDVWASLDDPLNGETVDRSYLQLHRHVVSHWYLIYRRGGSRENSCPRQRRERNGPASETAGGV